MDPRHRALLANGALIALSLLTSLALAEGLLRFGMESTRLVPNAPETPVLNQRRNELRFLERNRDSEQMGGHDPVLGWDAGPPATRVRGRQSVPAKSGRRAVALGDSFVFGNEVDADENFAALLDQAANGLEVLNMGVPGFGIDQSYLKYAHFATQYDADVVLFGIYVSDYERSTVAFTNGAKPLYQVHAEAPGAAVVLTNQPVPSPAAELERIRGSLKNRSYLLEFLSNRLPGARQTDAAFFNAADQLIEHILRRLRDSLRPDQRLLILHIPRGEAFSDPDPFHQEMSRRLKASYDRLNLQSLDLAGAFLRQVPAAEVARAYYVVRASGSVGHLNPAGHRLAAAAISARLDLRLD